MPSDKAHPDADTVAFAAPLSVWRTERYDDMGYFAIEGAAADAIGAHELARRRGFGSVKVAAAIGASRSVFLQKRGRWFLPVKKAIRHAEGIEAGDEVAVRLEPL